MPTPPARDERPRQFLAGLAVLAVLVTLGVLAALGTRLPDPAGECIRFLVGICTTPFFLEATFLLLGLLAVLLLNHWRHHREGDELVFLDQNSGLAARAATPYAAGPMTLARLGWSDCFATAFEPLAGRGWIPARLLRETTINFAAIREGGEVIDAVVAGKLWHDAETDAELPAVGDWVAIEMGADGEDHVIRARLPRRSCFSRKWPGKSSEEQVIAANVDVVAVMTDPGPDFNLRRMERYFALIGRSGAVPLVLVNKSDMFPALQCEQAAREIRALCPQAEVHVTSVLRDEGLAILRARLAEGVTMCIVGSSGVGKSTLVNQLLGGDDHWTGEVNEVTGKGRHTTAWRELVPLPGGGLLVDNPGMREVQMWTDERILRESFADVESMAEGCRFPDCRHQGDAGCAMALAVANGLLETGRLESFLRLDDEIEILRRRHKKRQMAVERWAKRNRKVKARNLADRIEYEKEQRPERW